MIEKINNLEVGALKGLTIIATIEDSQVREVNLKNGGTSEIYEFALKDDTGVIIANTWDKKRAMVLINKEKKTVEIGNMYRVASFNNKLQLELGNFFSVKEVDEKKTSDTKTETPTKDSSANGGGDLVQVLKQVAEELKWIRMIMNAMYKNQTGTSMQFE